jgi:hypothetical protein
MDKYKWTLILKSSLEAGITLVMIPAWYQQGAGNIVYLPQKIEFIPLHPSPVTLKLLESEVLDGAKLHHGLCKRRIRRNI